MTNFGMIYKEGRDFRVQPRHCICTNTLRGLLAIAEFLILHVASVHHNEAMQKMLKLGLFHLA